ncbi:hypothetical protein Desti_3190 [Desulfomonile tiedjei DSM 6799]|uniref:Uncharacterized protein n=1 Tax=Desulfomonile tiedjei (strain ATCC 49306 / DSM 6799 / DCB-1) TaxID=706587 RepID=I4C8G0_DESTA|nr:hypothetical protein [Desulfomonile tiedjei]AFM25851.1 hypothetical protein Desti_3190 [Desulfomonile tiedjei DSM 6799]
MKREDFSLPNVTQRLLDLVFDKRKQKLMGESLVWFSVNFPAMADFHDQHDKKIIFYSVDYTIISDSDTVKVV